MATVDDFRRLALSLEGAEERSHCGAPDFRVRGRIFATLAAQQDGYGNLMLTPDEQDAFVTESGHQFVPVRGGWGAMGATHVVLSAVSEDVLAGALHVAWKRRFEQQAQAQRKTRRRRPGTEQRL